jgi:hypothetical protein
MRRPGQASTWPHVPLSAGPTAGWTLLDDGWAGSVPQLATHLRHHQAALRRAITTHHLPQPPRRQQLARQRQHAAQQSVADRVAELAFENARAYLVDRLATNVWTLTRIHGELGAAPATPRRLLDQHQVRRVVPTRRSKPRPTGRGPLARHRDAQQGVAAGGHAGIGLCLRRAADGPGRATRRCCI